MTLLQLEHFVNTAECKSLTGAAARLYTSHSTLSRSISALESEFGCALLVRGARGIALTDVGKIFYEKAIKVLEAAADAKKCVEKAKGEYLRLLNVGSSIISFPSFFDAVNRFSGEHPHIKVSLTSGMPDEIYDKILSGELDIALTFSYAVTENNRITFRPLEKGGFYAYVSSSHPFASKPVVSYEDLNDGLVFISDDICRQIFGKKNLSQDVNTSQSGSEITMFTRSSNAVSILPEHIGDTLLPDCLRIPLNAKKDTYNAGILYASDNNNPSLLNFIHTFFN